MVCFWLLPGEILIIPIYRRQWLFRSILRPRRTCRINSAFCLYRLGCSRVYLVSRREICSLRKKQSVPENPQRYIMGGTNIPQRRYFREILFSTLSRSPLESQRNPSSGYQPSQGVQMRRRRLDPMDHPQSRTLEVDIL